jgi:hypothetical protein
MVINSQGKQIFMLFEVQEKCLEERRTFLFCFGKKRMKCASEEILRKEEKSKHMIDTIRKFI